jgi:preprotein translocase subunit YajC
MEDLDVVLIIFILLFMILIGYFIINEETKSKKETFKLCRRRR